MKGWKGRINGGKGGRPEASAGASAVIRDYYSQRGREEERNNRIRAQWHGDNKNHLEKNIYEKKKGRMETIRF